MSPLIEALASVPFPVIFAAPSGAGKTTIARALKERREDVLFSVSATTRPPRAWERDGVDYFFRKDREFREMVENGELLEWATVHGYLYGTPRRNVDAAAEAGCHLVLDIDVQGSRQIRDQIPQAVSIFVLPPSGGELARRLVGRGTEGGDGRRGRLLAARDELRAATEFDYVVVNDDLDATVDVVETILDSELHAVRRLKRLPTFIGALCAEVDEYLASGSNGPGAIPPEKE